MGFAEKVGKLLPRTMLKRKLSKVAPPADADLPPKTPRTATSPYFPPSDFSKKFIDIQLEFNTALQPLKFKPPVAYVYNPVEYAFKANESYVAKYCRGPKKLLFVGMNPGPFGMCQTGVPFGEIKSVRDWLGIEEEVAKPEIECPGCPVLGFACTRSEVSGDKLWNTIKKISGSPETFFQKCFVYNYCPLGLLKKDGGNITPSEIKNGELEEICDRFFLRVIQLLEPEVIVGLGRYTEKRALTTLKDSNLDIKVIYQIHPSPRVPGNQNWPEKAEKFYQTNDLVKYMT